jgi:cytochrome c
MRALGLACAIAVCALPSLVHAGDDALDLLVFTRTTGFRHDSIPAGIAAVQQMASERGWVAVASEDPAMFEPVTLAGYDVIVFLSTTGDVLDPVQEAALQGFIQAGGGFVGIHSATNTEEEWPWFVGLLGTTFSDHPAPQTATIHVEDAAHEATQGVPDPWVRFDEWYNFDSDPSAAVNVLLWLDESSYTGGTMGESHPIAWAHEYDGGRSFYTALGHTIEAWSEPEFLAHVAGGIEWAGTPAMTGGDSSSGGGSEDGPETSGGPPDSGDGTSTGTPPIGSSSGLDPASTTGAAGDGTSSTNAEADPASTGGCACASGRSPARGGPIMLALALFGLRRRSRG